MPEINKQFWDDLRARVLDILKWLGMGLLVGVLVGAASVLFAYCLRGATKLREAHTWMVYFLPVAGVAIAGFYKLLKSENDRGTNLLFASISSEDDVPIRMAPLIFVGTVLSHMFGASVGREGATLQLGGSIGNQIGKWFRFDKMDRKIMVMCGMSAAFSAIFGTPIASVVFAMEVATVGVMYYSAILPCAVSAIVARLLAARLGVYGESYTLSEIPAVDAANLGRCMVLGLGCGIVAILFCLAMHYMRKWEKKLLKNIFARAAAAGAVFVLVTALMGTSDYYGAGNELIERAIMEGESPTYAFAVKTILTALVLAGGFKGGEIVPSFCVGATFGCVMGGLLGLPSTLGAALGMTAVFCGVTNCPITAMMISFELFGFEAGPYILLVSAVSYVVSGYISLYSDQVFLHSKYKVNVLHAKYGKGFAHEKKQEK